MKIWTITEETIGNAVTTAAQAHEQLTRAAAQYQRTETAYERLYSALDHGDDERVATIMASGMDWDEAEALLDAAAAAYDWALDELAALGLDDGEVL
jgi:hypothetical protein